jgi:diguanylate cyclase (GGDEF)-like protein
MMTMQSLSLRQATQGKLLQPALSDVAWAPPNRERDNNIGNLDEALHVLAEAEQVIRKQAEHIRQLENLAMLDELTGLLNRRGFLMSLQRELALARRDAAANGVVVMVDLDGFKSINDMWGHNVGDDYLQVVAHTLINCVRASDVVARFGGDEFVILFPRMTESTGWKRLETLEKSFNSRIVPFGDKNLPLRASFGLSPYSGTDDPETILANADLKLYAHKASRRAARN